MAEANDYANPAAGDWAPWFEAKTPSQGTYNFGAIGGLWILLVFMGKTSAPKTERAMASLEAERSMFDGRNVTLFCVTADPQDDGRVEDRLPGWRWLLDQDFAVSRLYGAAPLSAAAGQKVPYRPCAILLDPQLRIHAMARIEQLDELLGLLRLLPEPADHAGIEMHAPVLVIPRVIEPVLCRHLIGLHESGSVLETGVMRQYQEKTVHELDDGFKRRSDHIISDDKLIDALLARIQRRVVVPIQRAFQFTTTHVERHIVACYDSANAGRFLPHRDNTTRGTAHRRFAVSINLNEDFTGGELVFPEFGTRGYKPPAGAAVVFGCSLLHWVTPMTAGRRFAYLPFLLDAAGAEIREANLAGVEWEARAGSRA